LIFVFLVLFREVMVHQLVLLARQQSGFLGSPSLSQPFLDNTSQNLNFTRKSLDFILQPRNFRTFLSQSS
jgi:hypothetical protein